MSLGYPWDNGEPLSVIADESSREITERTPHTLLRPVYINAVEVGYAYSQIDKDRRLHVRGITIAIWHFLSKGHQVIALLPHCFKTYSDKCSNWQELMHLHRMNLIEFTAGFGSDKYIEVNRILAGRARETGGCIVARSQMHSIIDESPQLDKTVEKRLLMPAFNGDDLIFPMDGPLGRSGPTLTNTLRCTTIEPEWGKCSHHQMRLKDQKNWMCKISSVLPERLTWSSLSTLVDNYTPKTLLTATDVPTRPATTTVHKVLPPETNPPNGRGYSHERRTMRRNGHDIYHFPRVEQSPMVLPNNIRNVDDLFLPDYMVGNGSCDSETTTPSDPPSDPRHSPPINGNGGGYGLENGAGGYTGSCCGGNCGGPPGYNNGGGGEYNRGNSGPNGYGMNGGYNNGGGGMQRRRGGYGNQSNWQSRGDFGGAGNYYGRDNCFNGNRFQDGAQPCRHSSMHRAQPMYERRYDRRSDQFFERSSSVCMNPNHSHSNNNQSFLSVNHTDMDMEQRMNMGNNQVFFDQIPRPVQSLKSMTEKEKQELFSTVAAILGYAKAKEVTEKYPGISSPQLLIEYALEGPANVIQREEATHNRRESVTESEPPNPLVEMAESVWRGETADSQRNVEETSSVQTATSTSSVPEVPFSSSWNRLAEEAKEPKNPGKLRSRLVPRNDRKVRGDLLELVRPRNLAPSNCSRPTVVLCPSETSVHTAVEYREGETMIMGESTEKEEEVVLIDFSEEVPLIPVNEPVEVDPLSLPTVEELINILDL